MICLAGTAEATRCALCHHSPLLLNDYTPEINGRLSYASLTISKAVYLWNSKHWETARNSSQIKNLFCFIMVNNWTITYSIKKKFTKQNSGTFIFAYEIILQHFDLSICWFIQWEDSKHKLLKILHVQIHFHLISKKIFKKSENKLKLWLKLIYQTAILICLVVIFALLIYLKWHALLLHVPILYLTS